MTRRLVALGLLSFVASALTGTIYAGEADDTSAALHAQIDRRARELEPKLVSWRRDFHQHPELSNRETRTSQVIEQHLRALGLDVQAGVAKTGVVALLRGGRPGPTIALRADMDGLPVVEEVDVPFKSTVKTTYDGREVGVMHACGHDLHMAILMGTAEILASLRAQIPGTIKFVFQPAEEGPPAGEEGGAALMVKEGVLDNPKVEAIFGLHVFPFEVGSIKFRPEGIMASSDTLRIRVRGRQTHGALPWAGVDPVVVASQIVLGLQTVISRQSDLTKAPAVVTIGAIHGGTRFNIVPDEVVMDGTMRTFDPGMRQDIRARLVRTAEQIAASAGATAEVEFRDGNPVTWNDPALTERMTASLKRVSAVAFDPNVQVTTTAEDFAHFQTQVPGLFFFLGITPTDAEPASVHPNHSPRFYADEGALPTGVRAMASIAVDYLLQEASQPAGVR